MGGEPAIGGLPDCPSGFGLAQRLLDVPYAALDPRNVLDLYLTDAPGPNPLFIWVHGGGWRGGSKDNVGRQFQDLVTRGYSIASIEYRLSDHPWPAPVADTKAAVRWLRANAAEYGLNPDKFVAAGSSAGGHLVAMLGTSADEPFFVDAMNVHPEVSDAVQTVVNFFGPTVIDQMDADAEANGCPDNALCHDCEGSPESLLLDCRPSQCPEVAAQASPVTYVNGDEPPFLTFHGQLDCTVPTPQGRRLHEALERADTDTTLFEVPEAGHSVQQVLAGDNLQVFYGFVERTTRRCAPPRVARPRDSLIGDCVWDACPAQAQACEANPVCVALEVCFQACFAEGDGGCINRCLADVENSDDGVAEHRPLFDCARPADCYR